MTTHTDVCDPSDLSDPDFDAIDGGVTRAVINIRRTKAQTTGQVPPALRDDEELEHVGWEAVLRKLPDFDPGRCELRGFAYTYAWGAIMDYLRRERPGTRRAPTYMEYLDAPLKDDPSLTLGDALAGSVDLEFRDPFVTLHLNEALSSVTPESRTAVFRVIVEGATYRQVATALGRSERGTWNLVNRTLTSLRSHPALRDARLALAD